MKDQRNTGMRENPLSSLGASTDWLVGELGSLGIELHPQAVLTRGLAELGGFRAKMLAGHDQFRFESTEAAVAYLLEVFGVDFLTKALHRGQLAGLRVREPYWSVSGALDVIHPAAGK